METTIRSLTLACTLAAGSLSLGAAVELHVAPDGADTNPGTSRQPFQTLHRAQQAVRCQTEAMTGDILVNLAPGEYRLDRALVLTEQDSGRNGFRVIYRSAAGPGEAKVLGSMPLVGWQKDRNGIWKIDLPEGLTFHTLYENGKRAWKARFPDYEHHADMPTARGRYLVSVEGSPASEKGDTTGWLAYAPEDQPPVVSPTTMDILVFDVGKCDWMRSVHRVVSIDPATRRITFKGRFWKGVRARARFFLENEREFLDAPGEFYLDQAQHTLYYRPLADGHPDTLGITAPVLGRLIELKGPSREQCVENISIEGLTLLDTDDSPPTGWWSAQYGRKDGALVWMGNTRGIEVCNCHLKNSGRNGIMMIGHNTDNLVTGCWIEHMGVNGVTLSNRFAGPYKSTRTEDRCERNRVTNCRIHDVGEIHCYASCVNAFNVSDNEVAYCDLFNSVRYAVTVRGNTGAQYGPMVWTNLPFCRGNRFHHLRIDRCGQDSGDMGALHGANLNIPEGDAINTFEQITVADCRAIPSMEDIPPDGIFLDWPEMCMHQIFRNVHIVRPQGRQLRSNRPENAASAQTENVSWEPNFDTSCMHYDTIGLCPDFPKEYGGASLPLLPPPTDVQATAASPDRIELTWQSAVAEGEPSVSYSVFRNDMLIGSTLDTTFEDRGLTEGTAYRYAVATRVREFAPAGPKSPVCEVHTPPDTTAPLLLGALAGDSAQEIWLRFSEPLDPTTATLAANYKIDRGLRVIGAETVSDPRLVRLRVSPMTKGETYCVKVKGVTDRATARNAVPAGSEATCRADQLVLHYTMDMTEGETLVDTSGSGRNARLKGNASWAPTGGRIGGALFLPGEDAYAEGPADFDLASGDFTLAAWIWKEHDTGMTILAKANGFPKQQWAWGWADCCFRAENQMGFHPDPADLGSKRWMHVAFVRRGNTGQAYVDGKASGGTHDLSVLGELTNGQPLLIGRRRHEQSPVWFHGKIDDVRIYGRALTDTEIGILALPK